MVALAAALLISSAPIVIAHRGASGERPEHTIEAYELAITQGADFIEPDLVMTKDGVLIARHENELSRTTDVAKRREFSERKRTKNIDGRDVTGWFSEDFTMEEIRKLRATEALPQLRTSSDRFSGKFKVPTFEEVIQVAVRASQRLKRPIGIYPELKHPKFFRDAGLPMEDLVAGILQRSGLKPEQVYIQSFEVESLKRLNEITEFPLIQLIDATVGPFDVPGKTPESMLTSEGLIAIKAYADGVGLNKNLVIPRNADGTLGLPSPVTQRAQRQGLKVHVWTFRNEPVFLPKGMEPRRELAHFLIAGIDGFFTDFPADGVRIRDAVERAKARTQKTNRS